VADICKHDWHFIHGTSRLECRRCKTETGPSTPEQLTQYTLHDSRPANTIQFYGGPEPRTEVLRLSKDGIWANPEIPCDEAAKKVLEAIDGYVKGMVERVRDETRREMQGRVETLDEMYKLVCRQRDELMDQQRAQIEGMRGRIQ
jgi:hypothetical protein